MEALYLYNYDPSLSPYGVEEAFDFGQRLDGHMIYKHKDGTTQLKEFKQVTKTFVDVFRRTNSKYTFGRISELTSKPYILNVYWNQEHP